MTTPTFWTILHYIGLVLNITCMYTYVYICMCTYVYICMCPYVCVRMYVSVCMCPYVCVRMYVSVCMCPYVCVRMYVSVYPLFRDILDLREIQQDMAQLVHEQGEGVNMIGK